MATVKENLAKFDDMVLKEDATWWQMELPSGNVFFGDAKAKMLGYPPEDFKKYQDFTKLLHKNDYDKAMQAMKDHLEGNKDVYETLYHIKGSDGVYRLFYDYGKIYERDGENITLIGFVLKIKNEENLDKETQAFKDLLSSGEQTIFDLFTRAKGI